jgi:hypothetical protein
MEEEWVAAVSWKPYRPHGTYGSKGAIIGGVTGGATALAGSLYWKLHNRAKLRGCVAARLVMETGSSMRRTVKTYSLTASKVRL